MKTEFNEKEVLFNLKTIMTILKVYKEDNIHQIKLIYGIDQILVYLKENGIIFEIHNDKEDVLQNACQLCSGSIHLIGAVSKKAVCLTLWNSKMLDT